MEQWDIYDRNGIYLGYTVPKGAVLQDGEFHLAAEAWLLDPRGNLLIQKRSGKCSVLPGMWAMTTGGIQAGETPQQGCVREIHEELGIDVSEEQLVHLGRMVRTDGSQLIWDVFACRLQGEHMKLKLDPLEVEQTAWISCSQLEELFFKDRFYCYPEIQDILTLVKQFAFEHP